MVSAASAGEGSGSIRGPSSAGTDASCEKSTPCRAVEKGQETAARSVVVAGQGPRWLEVHLLREGAESRGEGLSAGSPLDCPCCGIRSYPLHPGQRGHSLLELPQVPCSSARGCVDLRQDSRPHEGEGI